MQAQPFGPGASGMGRQALERCQIEVEPASPDGQALKAFKSSLESWMAKTSNMLIHILCVSQ